MQKDDQRPKLAHDPDSNKNSYDLFDPGIGWLPLPARPSAFVQKFTALLLLSETMGLIRRGHRIFRIVTMTERRRLCRQGTIPAAPCNSHPLPGTVRPGYLVACTANLYMYIHTYRHHVIYILVSKARRVSLRFDDIINKHNSANTTAVSQCMASFCFSPHC